MQIALACPAESGSLSGNRRTALRYAAILRQLGHCVRFVRDPFSIRPHDELLIALHARKSAPWLAAWQTRRPNCPTLLVLTGTDLYEDRNRSPVVKTSLATATRIVVLQPDAMQFLPKSIATKTRVIVQSAKAPPTSPQIDPSCFEVCVSGHLRSVKDPLRAAMASRLLPADSRIRIVQMGACMDPHWQRRVQQQSDRNPRFRYLGALPHRRSLQVLARSRLLVVSSRSEGGPNVASEAIACGVPIVGTCISGLIGLLGADYPGYFSVGDTRALAQLLRQAETDSVFYRQLRRHVQRLRTLVDPLTETRAWRQLLAELT